MLKNNHTVIVQKYLNNLILYNKRKFDIRHFMLICCAGSKIRGYWYQDGYLRTSGY